jgi:hypothetical protein
LSPAVISYHFILDVCKLGKEFIQYLFALSVGLNVVISLSIWMESRIPAIKNPCLHSIYHRLLNLGLFAFSHDEGVTNPIVFTLWPLKDFVLLHEIVVNFHALFVALMSALWCVLPKEVVDCSISESF